MFTDKACKPGTNWPCQESTPVGRSSQYLPWAGTVTLKQELITFLIHVFLKKHRIGWHFKVRLNWIVVDFKPQAATLPSSVVGRPPGCPVYFSWNIPMCHIYLCSSCSNHRPWGPGRVCRNSLPFGANTLEIWWNLLCVVKECAKCSVCKWQCLVSFATR